MLLVEDRYDDGGVSGGTLSALPSNDCWPMSKLTKSTWCWFTRLTGSRSMLDFLKLVETFERHGVTFVSSPSVQHDELDGRLTLNMLLSFAQFEREVIGERIRDKVAASRKKGMWMGGWTRSL